MLSSSIDTIMSKASSTVVDITENTCSSSFQILTIDDIAQTVQKLAQDGCKPSLPIFFRMELEGTLLDIIDYDDPIVETTAILYNFASAYKFLATTNTTRTQTTKYLERAIRFFELLLSVADSYSTFGEFGKDGYGLGPLAFSILALHGLVGCTTMKNASVSIKEKYAKKLSALFEEFFSHEALIEVFLDSSSLNASAA